MQRDPEQTETAYLHQFANLAGQRVLEIGCGNGRLTWRYAGLANRVTAIDPDMSRLITATGDCPPSLRSTVSFARAKSEALPFARDTFDLAVLAWSL